jgi:hypothetical protein
VIKSKKSNETGCFLKPDDFVANALALDRDCVNLRVFSLNNHRGANNDKVFVCFFNDGGGILSYEKQNDAKFVHTLNNASGMKRKLESLNCTIIDNDNGNFELVENDSNCISE